MSNLVETVAGMIKPTVKTIHANGSVTVKPLTPQKDFWDDPYMDDYRYDGYWKGRGYGGYGGYGGYTGGTGAKVSSTVSSIPRKVEVQFPNGQTDRWTIPYDGKGWWDIAKTVWPVREDKDADVMTVPSAHCEFSYGEPKFNSCVYTGTNDYLQARWGRKLDDSDRRWLAAHQYATDGGIPQEYTATCIDQLVTPYGMRISRVRLRKGALVLGDSLMGWLMALGCNPMAMADRSTSNAQAAELLGIPLDQANALWRVEFHDEPLPCSIVGERGWTNGSGVSTGSFGGHCRYLAPRAKPGDWFISVQLEMDTQVSHLVPPPNPEYVPRKGDPTLLFTEITGPDNTLIAIKVNGTWAPASGGPITPVVAATPVDTTPEPREVMTDDEFLPCDNCSTPTDLTNLVPQSLVCQDCLLEAWRGYTCPHCEEQFDEKNVPLPVSYDDGVSTWQCGCTELITMKDGEDRYIDDLIPLLFDLVESDADLPPSLQDLT